MTDPDEHRANLSARGYTAEQRKILVGGCIDPEETKTSDELLAERFEEMEDDL